MKTRTRIVSITFVFLLQLTGTGRSEDQQPDSLLGFIKPGMSVGVSPDDPGPVSLRIYSAKQFDIAKDAQTMSLDELRAKYKEVEEKIEQTLAELVSASSEGDEPSGVRVRLVPTNYWLGTVKHVGKDYVLLATADSRAALIAIRASNITSLRFDFTGAILSVSRDGRGLGIR